VGIDLVSGLTLARYCAYLPTYFNNTWFRVYSGISVGIAAMSMGCLYKVKTDNNNYNDAIMVLVGLSAGGLFLSVVLTVLSAVSLKSAKNQSFSL
jgi:hypothetical protein